MSSHATIHCAASRPPRTVGLIRALRADLAPRGCGDAVVGEDAAVPGATRDVADALVALGVGARLYRSMRDAPLPRPPFSKEQFLKHFKEVLSPWLADQAHAVETLSRLGPRLNGYAKAIVALEAGLADMRFVGVARAIELPAEMKSDAEVRETYLVALEQALELRVTRGRDAALVGLGELSRLGITNDARMKDARALLSELYAGRRIDALDRLQLPPLAAPDTSSAALKVAAKLPAFYAQKLDASPKLDDPKLLRARLEQGVPPAVWLASSQAPPAPELLALSQRALFQLGQTYFWAEAFARAAALPPLQDSGSELIFALAKVLARGPRNAAAMMLGPPTLPADLRDTSALDAQAGRNTPDAGRAELDAAYVRGLAPPANDPAFWKEQAARYERAQKKLESKAAKAIAGELAKAAQDTEKALRHQATATP
ncbi:MAG TPA: hypothetical protein VJN18_22950 [Polyangiaceae bacterium]|nr:hypothetical protein [Polyangiaceae bacterium]